MNGTIIRYTVSEVHRSRKDFFVTTRSAASRACPIEGADASRAGRPEAACGGKGKSGKEQRGGLEGGCPLWGWYNLGCNDGHCGAWGNSDFRVRRSGKTLRHDPLTTCPQERTSVSPRASLVTHIRMQGNGQLPVQMKDGLLATIRYAAFPKNVAPARANAQPVWIRPLRTPGSVAPTQPGCPRPLEYRRPAD